uniref:Putative viral iap-associated factor n=1 Tax=Ixodes ricinus TaxID=34613 RepID=A0A0K8RAE7_IXORI
MANPNEDTQWNDVLRQKGILPPKKEDTEKVFTEDEIVNVVESTIYEKLNGTQKAIEDLSLEELEELEDEEDERALLHYRQMRLAEIQATLQKSRYGDVRESLRRRLRRASQQSRGRRLGRAAPLPARGPLLHPDKPAPEPAGHQVPHDQVPQRRRRTNQTRQ